MLLLTISIHYFLIFIFKDRANDEIYSCLFLLRAFVNIRYIVLENLRFCRLEFNTGIFLAVLFLCRLGRCLIFIFRKLLLALTHNFVKNELLLFGGGMSFVNAISNLNAWSTHCSWIDFLKNIFKIYLTLFLFYSSGLNVILWDCWNKYIKSIDLRTVNMALGKFWYNCRLRYFRSNDFTLLKLFSQFFNIHFLINIKDKLYLITISKPSIFS